MEVSIKPKKESYVRFHFITVIFFMTIIGILIFLSLRSTAQMREYALYPGLALFILVILYNIIAIPIQFRKEEYVLYPDRIVSRGGGIFSDYERELLVKNITHVDFLLPYLENKFYQTGSIHIQSAGGAQTEIKMQCLEKPHDIYSQITEILQKNGFSLGKKEEIRQSSPHGLGTIAQGIVGFVGSASGFGFLCFGLPLYFGLSFIECAEVYILNVIILLSSIASAFYLIGKMKNTSYILYDDTIINKATFLNYHESLIPIENLSDSTLKQGILGRILGIYDLKLSCQGGGQEINFQYITKGNDWKSALDELLKDKPTVHSEEITDGKSLPSTTKKIGKSDYKKDNEYTASLRMNKKRAYLPGIVFLVIGLIIVILGVALISIDGIPQNEPSPLEIMFFVIVFVGGIFCFASIIALIGKGIQYSASKYYIRAKGFAKEFNFLAKSTNEYSAEKVTGIIIHQGILDRWINTCSIKFWSIGSNQALEFANIHKDTTTVEKVLNKKGIYSEDTSHEIIKSNATMDNFFKEYIFLYGILFVGVLAIMVAFGTFATIIAGAVFFILAIVPFSIVKLRYSFQSLKLYKDHLIFQNGIFFRKKYYIRYDDLKYVTRKCYPFSLCGSLTFDITGEQIVQQGKSQVKKSNSFVMEHVDNVDHLHIISGLLIEKKIQPQEIPNLEYNMDKYVLPQFITSYPKIKQFVTERSILVTILNFFALAGIAVFYILEKPPFSILFFVIPLITINFIVLWFIKVYANKISYAIDEEKVTKCWGVFYKKKMTLHYLDIDYITKQKGFFNNMYKTGDIEIHTVGSSQKDMVLHALEDYENFYEILKTGYQSRR